MHSEALAKKLNGPPSLKLRKATASFLTNLFLRQQQLVRNSARTASLKLCSARTAKPWRSSGAGGSCTRVQKFREVTSTSLADLLNLTVRTLNQQNTPTASRIHFDDPASAILDNLTEIIGRPCHRCHKFDRKSLN